MFAVHEKNNTVVVANKKKIQSYGWQGPGFVLRKEFNVFDVPKSILCVGGSVVIGYKKFYECLDLTTGLTNRLLDVEKECKMVSLELPVSPFRAESTILSLGLQGVVLDTAKILAGASFAFGNASEERLEWSSQPVSAVVANPFIVTLLSDAVEIHDIGTLHTLQKIQITSSSPHVLSMCSCFIDVAAPVGNSSSYAAGGLTASSQCVFLCNGEQLSALKMIPIMNQVTPLFPFKPSIDFCVNII